MYAIKPTTYEIDESICSGVPVKRLIKLESKKVAPASNIKNGIIITGINILNFNPLTECVERNKPN